MKITRGTPQFTPVVITLESEEEVEKFRAICNANLRIPAIMTDERADDFAHTRGSEILCNGGGKDFDSWCTFLAKLGEIYYA